LADSARFHLFDSLRLWYNREETAKSDGPELENTITLSEAFHNEIDRHKIPVERRVVAALANAPGTLDLYLWLVWRSWSLEAGRRARVPLFGSTSLSQQGRKYLGSHTTGRGTQEFDVVA
jgi:hypothetical protein